MEYILPGSVILLKLAFRLFVEQQAKLVDVAKALLLFPIDIAFLSFSFGSALLLHVQLKASDGVGAREILVMAVVCIVLALVVTALCKKSDRAFDGDENLKAVALAIGGYALAVGVLVASLTMGSIL